MKRKSDQVKRRQDECQTHSASDTPAALGEATIRIMLERRKHPEMLSITHEFILHTFRPSSCSHQNFHLDSAFARGSAPD
ncbi:hypothetical protein GGD63_007246 [Bradyrhizobium sp. cir1]|uniref:hypothetical protein n=1 Tax=Bradyrhizobium sp. cir1 TaxID=1445730 RepID=UPI001605BACD|nr:hypothetical protein [Bradyrhizobium sp. cir1]MBB4374416.1 hypothetical protein [Bradyrhizobium sp. cir1]